MANALMILQPAQQTTTYSVDLHGTNGHTVLVIALSTAVVLGLLLLIVLLARGGGGGVTEIHHHHD